MVPADGGPDFGDSGKLFWLQNSTQNCRAVFPISHWNLKNMLDDN